MYLPESERLSIQSLSRVFSDMSESYKIFWFSGVLDVIKSGRASATFDEIINQVNAINNQITLFDLIKRGKLHRLSGNLFHKNIKDI